MKIARLQDRFVIKLEEVELVIAPLSGRQKIEMTSCYKQDEKGRLSIDRPAQELYLIKHSVKALKGLKDLDEKEYELEFDVSGNLSTDCAEEILGFLANTFFTLANTQAMRGMFGDVLSPFDNTPLKGVSVERLIKEEDEKK